jgi:hypothetical protein
MTLEPARNAPVGAVYYPTVPEPYETQMNAILGRMRAQLFTVVEMGMPGDKQEPARREVRRATATAWVALRAMVNGIVATEDD